MSQKITDYSATVPLPGALDNTSKPQSDAHLSTKLSQAAFANPKEFMQVLKNDFDRIAKSGSSEITQNDLVLYSEHGDDVKGRAAAALAAKHFDQLEQMSYMHGKPQTLSKAQLDSNIDYVDNNIGDSVHSIRVSGAGMAVQGALLTRMCVLTAVGTTEVPPVAITFGILAGGLAVVDGYIIKKIITARKDEQRRASDEQRTVQSWL